MELISSVDPVNMSIYRKEEIVSEKSLTSVRWNPTSDI